MSTRLVLLIAAIVAFILAAFGASVGDVNLIAIGLAFFAASFIANK